MVSADSEKTCDSDLNPFGLRGFKDEDIGTIPALVFGPVEIGVSVLRVNSESSV